MRTPSTRKKSHFTKYLHKWELKETRSKSVKREAIYVPGVTTTGLLYTDHQKGKKLIGKENVKIVVANYSTSNLALKSEKVPNNSYRQYEALFTTLG